jgi:hypothetical protein
VNKTVKNCQINSVMSEIFRFNWQKKTDEKQSKTAFFGEPKKMLQQTKVLE